MHMGDDMELRTDLLYAYSHDRDVIVKIYNDVTKGRFLGNIRWIFSRAERRPAKRVVVVRADNSPPNVDDRITDEELEAMTTQLLTHYINRLENEGVGQHQMTLYY